MYEPNRIFCTCTVYIYYMYVHVHVCTHISFISLHLLKANANQRSGRAGRTGAG